jgi:hypothetical protein
MGQGAFRKWFTRELLGANWKIVPQARLKEQGDNVKREGEGDTAVVEEGGDGA